MKQLHGLVDYLERTLAGHREAGNTQPHSLDTAHFLRLLQSGVEEAVQDWAEARDALLDLRADAPTFIEHGDEGGVLYEIITGGEQLERLMDAVGLGVRPDETPGMAFDRIIDAETQQDMAGLSDMLDRGTDPRRKEDDA